jgi:hypothetical protein
MKQMSLRGLFTILLVAFAVFLTGGGEASADLMVSGGIVVVGGGGNGTDTEVGYTYEFGISVSGSINSSTPSMITFTADNLVGVSALSPNFAVDVPAYGGWAVSSIVADSMTGLPDVTWTYTGSPTSISASPVFLGIVGITTTSCFASGYPVPLPTSVGYSYSTVYAGESAQIGPTSGAVALQQGGILAPEPSTLIAPLVVLLGLPISRLLKRRLPRKERTGLTS